MSIVDAAASLKGCCDITEADDDDDEYDADIVSSVKAEESKNCCCNISSLSYRCD